MVLYEFLHKYDFESLVPHLIAIDPKSVPDNLYAFKEAFDDLRRMSPADASGNQIVVSTEVDLDEKGNEVERYLNASGCGGDAWEVCLAKEVIFGTAVGEEKALARILWHLTFWGFTPEHEGLRDDAPANKYVRKAKELERRKFLNYAKGIAHQIATEHLCLTDAGWAEYHRRESHRNRAKRMRDARQERSIARLERMGKVQRLIDRCLETSYDADFADFRYLFDSQDVCVFDFYSRTDEPIGRGQYIIDNVRKYFNPSLLEDYVLFTVFAEAHMSAVIEEIFPALTFICDLIRNTNEDHLESIRIRNHFGLLPNPNQDLHVILICSR